MYVQRGKRSLWWGRRKHRLYCDALDMHDSFQGGKDILTGLDPNARNPRVGEVDQLTGARIAIALCNGIQAPD
jgi:hypothetical protein